MNPIIRSMVRETELSKNDFIYPLFVVPGTKFKKEVSSMPGVFQMSINETVRECVEVKKLGIPAIVKDDEILNDPSVELLAKEALTHAQAGADMVAPSDMFDGRVKVIRDILDKNNFHNLPIMSYAAKYASGFYGPFREAAESTPQFGDRRSHQMGPANSDEALREVAADIEEGADIVMVKPALPYLDVIRRVKAVSIQ